MCKRADPIEIIGYDKCFKSNVNGIETFHQTVDRGEAGDQLGVLLKGIKREQLRRGMCVVKPGSMAAHNNFKAKIYALSKDEGGVNEPIVQNSMILMFSLTWNAPARVSIVGEGKELVMPGEDASVNILLRRSMPMENGQRFTIRNGSTTIGTGIITDVMTSFDELEIRELWKAKKKAATTAGLE